MKILFVLSSMNIGGLEVFTVNLANKFISKGHETAILIFKSEEKEGVKLIDNDKIKIFFVQRKHKLDFLFIIRIYKIIKTFKPQIIFSLSAFAYFFTEIAKKFINLHIPHCIRFASYKPLSAREHIYVKFFTFFSKIWGAYYIFVSNSQAEYYSEEYRFLHKKTKIIFNGININFFSPENSMEHKVFTIGHIANVRPVKDQWTLFKALEKLDSELKNWKLIFVGENVSGVGLLEEFKKYVEKSSLSTKIIFLKLHEREQIKKVLSELDVFVLTSTSEGLPNSPLEAMAMNVPCILTAVGGCPEIVVDGYNGYLVQPKDYEAIAGKLLFLSRNPGLLEQMGKNARKTVLEKFSLDVCAEKYLSLFSRIINPQ